MKKYFVLFITLLLAGYTSSFGELADTVWVRETQGINQYISRLQFSLDDSKILSIGESAYIFDTKTGNVLKQLNGYGDGQYSNDGTKLLLAKEVYDTNKQVHPVIDIYNAVSYEKIKTYTLGVVAPGSTQVKLSNDGKTLAVVNDTKITFVDFETGEVKKILGGFDNNTGIYYRIMDFIFTKDDKDLIIAIISGKKGEYGSLLYINTSTYKKDYEGTQEANKLAISNDGTMLAITNLNANSAVQILNTQSHELISSIPGDANDVSSFAFTNDNLNIGISYFGYRYFDIWNIVKKSKNNQYVVSYNGSAFAFSDLIFSHNNDYVLASSGGGLLLIKNNTTSILNSNDNNTSIYPNPTNGIVTINTNCLTPQLQYTITNVSGQNLFNSFVANINNQIQISFLTYPIGTYYLNLNCNNETSNYKIIKE